MVILCLKRGGHSDRPVLDGVFVLLLLPAALLALNPGLFHLALGEERLSRNGVGVGNITGSRAIAEAQPRCFLSQIGVATLASESNCHP